MAFTDSDVIRVLREEDGPIKTLTVSQKLGGNKARDVKSILDELLREDLVTKSVVGKDLFWSVRGHSVVEVGTRTACGSDSGSAESGTDLSTEKLVSLLLKQQQDE